MRRRQDSLGWVRQTGAKTYSDREGKALSSISRHTVVHVRRDAGDWVELDSGRWMKRIDVSRVLIEGRPGSVRSDERWIDVNLDEQVVVAYEGDTPVYATLTSSGKQKEDFETPKGEFRIWAKLVFADMDNTDVEEDIEKAYSLRKVPWVLFFKDAIGFHTAFWHNDFGRRRSHGCLNLSPIDARYIFNFSRPVLPDGWKAILPGTGDRSTLVRVH
ncbi:MAG: L,D-transpeptidase [Polyangiales bacterium]